MIFEYKRTAKKISMVNTKPNYTGARVTRNRFEVFYIVIHSTGKKRDSRMDTAKGIADFFASGNNVHAGIHIIIDRQGIAALSVPLKYIAYHCGDYRKTFETGSGSYYQRCTNSNSIGIELCGISDRYMSGKQRRKLKKVVKWVQKRFPNAETVIRHWDVNGKDCPHMYTGAYNKFWEDLKYYLKCK